MRSADESHPCAQASTYIRPGGRRKRMRFPRPRGAGAPGNGGIAHNERPAPDPAGEKRPPWAGRALAGTPWRPGRFLRPWTHVAKAMAFAKVTAEAESNARRRNGLRAQPADKARAGFGPFSARITVRQIRPGWRRNACVSPARARRQPPPVTATPEAPVGQRPTRRARSTRRGRGGREAPAGGGAGAGRNALASRPVSSPNETRGEGDGLRHGAVCGEEERPPSFSAASGA